MKTEHFGRQFLIWTTSLVLLIGSVMLTIYVQRSVEQRRTAELSQIINEVERSMVDKIEEGVDLLYDLKGLTGLSEDHPGDWNDHFKALISDQHHQDFAMAYVPKIDKKELKKFELEMRTSGQPGYENYQVFPKSDSPTIYPIKYLYSTDTQIKGLLGFDLQTSENTIKTLQLAEKTNQPVMSELSRLEVIFPQSKKTGYGMIMPIFKDENIEEVPAEKRDVSLVGFIGIWINTDNLSQTFSRIPGIRYSLFDGDQQVMKVGSLQIDKPMHTISSEFNLLNRKMKIILDTDRKYRLSDYEENLSTITLVMVLTINILWVLSIYSFISADKRAGSLVEFATRDLKKFKQAVDGVSDHVVITNIDGTIIYVNKAAMKITGYTEAELIGKKPSLWGGNMSKEYYQRMWRTIRDEKMPFEDEVTNTRKNGESYEAEMHISPILDEQKNLLFFVGIERDLSKERAVEKIKTEFISLASHQLRTPLSAVKWFTEMLKNGDGGPLSKKQKQFVDRIEESNQREITIVNSLLSLSRMESGKISVIPKPTDLKILVKSIIGDFEVNPEGQGKTFIDRVSEKLPIINIDADLIRHVYSNLISNAIRYTGEKGEITVKVYAHEGKIISEVSDNGIGIPMEEQERMFQKFFRASNALKKFTEGSGLGLYLTKAIIESSGGEIRFSSVEGKGTTFEFTLPIKTPPVKAGKS